MSIGIPFGKYRLTRRLARGGMAEVFLASQRGPGEFERTVAVKRILPHLADIPQFLQMFLDEARLAAQLSHPNIAHIYEFGQVDDSFFIAMEYIDGIDLSVVVLDGPKRPLPLEHVSRIIADVCAALHYAHQLKDKEGRPLGLVHRDISPQNILVSFDGAVKMVDFGIAKAAYHIERTKPGVVRGKFTYMSPEQVMGKTLDGRSDLFSAGIVLYELCTCQALFPRTDAVQAMQLIRRAEIPEPKRDGKSLPKGLTRIIKRALARDREERYQTAAEMQMDLDEFLRSTNQISNSILLGGYFSEHYRRLRPDPSVEDKNEGRRTADIQRGTRPAALQAKSTLPVGRDPSTDTSVGPTVNGVDLDGRTQLLDPPKLSNPTIEASGVIFNQPTESKSVAGQTEDIADTRFSLHSTLVGVDQPRYEESGELESPTVEIVTGPGSTLPGTDGATTIQANGGDAWAGARSKPSSKAASATLSVRQLGRRLMVAGMVTSIAVVGVVLGYVVSSPPEVTPAAVPDATAAVVPDLAPALASSPDLWSSEGSLVIDSDPPGASVKVDELVIAGVTPVKRSFPPGTHSLVVSLPGHADQEQEVELAAGQTLKINFVLRRLKPEKPEKVVQLRQAGLEAKQRTRPKRRPIKRRRPHRPRRSAAKAAKPPEVAAKGPAGHGYLNITTIPWSWVYLGRRKLGQTPLARVQVPAGTHRLFFTNPNAGETYRTVKVEPDQVTKLRFRLR